jgi:hypothetical protein
MKDSVERLEYLLAIVPPLLQEINDDVFSLRDHPSKWSKKEILGHLIDSASNNHHRFVRSQFEENPTITYKQNEWNRFNFYNLLSSEHVINFWIIYNTHILELIKNMQPENLQRKCSTELPSVTVEFLFEDYIKHLEHHLRQIINYN